MRAPVLGGNFGVWGGLFSTFDCAVKGIRKKEDPYNAIIAGFFTGGSLAVRGGYKAARNGAIGCAVLLAVIEGVGIAFQKMMAGGTKLEVRALPSHCVFALCLFLYCLTVFSDACTSAATGENCPLNNTRQITFTLLTAPIATTTAAATFSFSSRIHIYLHHHSTHIIPRKSVGALGYVLAFFRSLFLYMSAYLPFHLLFFLVFSSGIQ